MSPPPGGGPAGSPARRRRARWIAVGALVALAGVVAATALYLFRDRYPDLEFQTVDELTRVQAGPDRPTETYTAMLGGRAYLAYPLPDDRLEVVAVDTGTGSELWRKQTAVSAQRWDRIVALPGALAVFADASGDSTPRDLVLLDGASGAQRWHRPVRGDDDVFFTDEVAVLVDRTGDRLVGLRLRDGTEKWTRPNPRDEYDNARTSVHPVTTADGVDGPAFLDGTPRDPWRSGNRRLVQLGADRSARVIDMATGNVLNERSEVADHDDLVVAHEDRLFVATDDAAYRLLAYDLTSRAEPAVLYTAPDDKRRPKALTSCGERRACLLEVRNGEAESSEVVAATEEKPTARWAAPNADLLVPLGEHLLARRTYPEPAATLFDPAGKALLRDRDGVAVRLDAGNLLVFAEPPSTAAGDRTVAGVWADSGEPDELGQLKDVRSESCSWNTEVIACGAEKDFVLYRFATG